MGGDVVLKLGGALSYEEDCVVLSSLGVSSEGGPSPRAPPDAFDRNKTNYFLFGPPVSHTGSQAVLRKCLELSL